MVKRDGKHSVVGLVDPGKAHDAMSRLTGMIDQSWAVIK